MIELSIASTIVRLRDIWQNFWEHSVPSPQAGQIRYQFIAIMLLAFIQLTILPSMLPAMVFIDLLSPWLALSLVFHSHFRAYLLTLISGILLETHLPVPIGFILSPYFCFAVLVLNIRNHISWRRISSWVTLLAIFQLWLMGFKLLFDMMHYDKQQLINLSQSVQFLMTGIGSVLFGLLLIYKNGLLLIDEDPYE